MAAIVFTVMGGYMAGCGVLTLFLARVAIPRRLPGSAWALGFAGLSIVVGFLVSLCSPPVRRPAGADAGAAPGDALSDEA